jgi:hypothetical protein
MPITLDWNQDCTDRQGPSLVAPEWLPAKHGCNDSAHAIALHTPGWIAPGDMQALPAISVRQGRLVIGYQSGRTHPRLGRQSTGCTFPGLFASVSLVFA